MAISGVNSVAVVGLGYVGLPLALAFGRKIKTIGFEISQVKVDAYNKGVDPTGEMEAQAFADAKDNILYTTDVAQIKEADVVIVAVPTPINHAKQPDLTPVEKASVTVGRNLKPGAIVVFESTVYPGATEEVCVPILEKESSLKWKKDFNIGYSPERINPGDKVNTLEKIVKVVSGDTAEVLETVAQVYELVIDAGVHRAASIKVAEAAKVIENTQRDLNIALMNELAVIFNIMDIDTLDVLEAAGTKWNFLPFRPGLVGGHCIGVDPYYLTYKASVVGYHPEVILAGRRINDGMGKFIAEQTVKKMIAQNAQVKGAKVLIMGLTFKENCADLRNTRVVDVVEELETYGVDVVIWDPVAEDHEAQEEYGINLAEFDNVNGIDAIVAAVSHEEILKLDLQVLAAKCKGSVPFIDVKSAFCRDELAAAGFDGWRL
ncbi:MAG: nucleotide sugar dehydrogenase [Gammaproteobacteria bacterium]|nr:MAG: nucleotide sugar dehydrogenase [Gammaproteobacteria bacterium]